MQKITPFLWFDDNAEEAVNFYMSVFKNSKVNSVTRYGSAGPGEPGKVMTISFEIEGLTLTALNGGPYFKFTEAISLEVACVSQAEVDELWDKLTADGGEPSQCGWLKDKFGLSWQIVPTAMMEFIQGSDPAGAQRAMAAMLKMSKLDLAVLRQAYAGA
ncbi:MAG TPA: VOC family protein [Anaerolineae bacterium]|nr:VOC family protein [Anaerolineae bacterium]